MISEPLTRFVDDPTQPLRDALVDTLITAGDITSPQIASAFRVVPRHVFAPEVPLEQAYRADDSIRIKRDAQGATTSAISAPYLHAVMLGRRTSPRGCGAWRSAPGATTRR